MKPRERNNQTEIADSRGRANRRPLALLRAFTLIELIVVVAIIGILLTMVLPSASKMWSQRNEAATYNLIRGLLESARTQAIRNGERGLFFFLDPDGTQRVVFIRGESPDYTKDGEDACDCHIDCCGTKIVDCVPTRCIVDSTAVHRFRTIRGQIYSIPKPYQVSGSWVANRDQVEREIGASGFETALRNNSWKTALGAHTPYYHRSFFAIIFNARGEVIPERNVLIHDPDTVEQTPQRGDGYGDVTLLRTENSVQDFWGIRDDGARERMTFPPGTSTLYDMIRLDSDGVVANFRGVAGLVVYDESDLEGLDGAGIAEVITRTGQPCFVSRYTGEVIFGKKGP